MTDLLKTLANTLHAELRKDNRYHCACPFCGKPAKHGHKHFSFVEQGYICWVGSCGAKGSLKKLADTIGLDTGNYAPPEYHQETIKVESSVFPYSLIERYEKHPKRIQLWQSYKPLSEELIIKYRLGVGRLPKEDGTFYSDERLIVPLVRDGKLVMLRGRSMQGSKHPAKWLTRGTPARLFNGDLITSNSIVVIMENWIDALLAMMLLPDVTPVATSGGASTWLDSWSHYIAKIKPKGVILAMDNDKAGRDGNLKVANDLAKAGYSGLIRFHEYAKGTPEKASLIDCM